MEQIRHEAVAPELEARPHSHKPLQSTTSARQELPIRSSQLDLSRPMLAPRRSTDPSGGNGSVFQGYFAPLQPQTRPHTSHPRNRSPYSRSHLRSKSTGASLLTPPAMTRAHSMPNPHSLRLERDPLSPPSLSPAVVTSQRSSPARAPSPLRSALDDNTSAAPMARSFAWLIDGPGGNVVETIEEDSELDLTPRSISSPSHLHTSAASFARPTSSRRRPTSPLHSLMGLSSPSYGAPTSHPNATSDSGNSSLHTSTTNSPALAPQKYNEAYPPLHHYASSSSFSSMPSTPTSQRSRSPSISSLDTIEDEPDLESQAIENERIEQLRLAAERQERGEMDSEEEPRRRSSFDTSRGFGRGALRERKRWSVCGGERRGDIDLETIWED